MVVVAGTCKGRYTEQRRLETERCTTVERTSRNGDWATWYFFLREGGFRGSYAFSWLAAQAGAHRNWYWTWR